MTFNKHQHKHGHSVGVRRSPTYRVWLSLKQRCTNPKRAQYIKYYDKWYAPWADFEVFLADMGERPEGLTIERINNALPYGPDNCTWATRLVQGRNRSTNKIDAAKAAAIRKQPKRDARDLAAEYGVTRATIYHIRNNRTWRLK